MSLQPHPGGPFVEQATAAPGELREVRHAPEGDYVEVWECDAPPLGVSYRVLEETWNTDYSERRIRRIEVVDGE